MKRAIVRNEMNEKASNDHFPPEKAVRRTDRWVLEIKMHTCNVCLSLSSCMRMCLSVCEVVKWVHLKR